MVNPLFERLPDRSAAEAMSELYQDGVMRYATDESIVERYGDRVFPPAPSNFVTVTAAFLEQHKGGVGVRQSTAALNPRLARDPSVSTMYADTVGGFQSSFPKLEDVARATPEFGGLHGMQEWCVRQVARERHRMLGAHVVARVIEDGQFIDSFAYSRSIGEQLPLLIRDAVISRQPMIDEVISLGMLTDEEAEAFRNAARPLYQRHEIAANLAVVAVSSFMPKPEEFKRMMSGERPSDNVPPALNRADRRRQARNKRRP